MRCRKCSVDVSENTVFCPLCGERVFDDPPVLHDLSDIPYPTGVLPKKPEKEKLTPFGAAKHITRAAAAAGGILNAAGRITGKKQLIDASGALCAASAAVSLAACVKEKGELMKGATPLLISTVSAAVFALPSGKKHSVRALPVMCFGACAAMNAAAYMSAPQKMKDQYAAVFRIYGEH